MHGVEFPRLRVGEPEAFLRDDAQALIFEFRVDLARKIAARGVRLDDGECAFDGRHCFLFPLLLSAW